MDLLACLDTVLNDGEKHASAMLPSLSMDPLIRKFIGDTTILHIKDQQYNICELEYYYNDQTNHQDPYVHSDSLQLDHDTFYFHRINGKGYKEGTFKGVDITFGSNNEYGGLLIRSIKNIKTNELVEGPCLVVQEILKAFNLIKVRDYVKQAGSSNIYDKGNQVWIEHVKRYSGSIDCSPRVGLTFKPGGSLEEKIKYIMRNYRATTLPNVLKKQRCTIRIKPSILGPTSIKTLEELSLVKTRKVADIKTLYHHAQYYNALSIKQNCNQKPTKKRIFLKKREP